MNRMQPRLLELLVDLLVRPVDGFDHLAHGVLDDDRHRGRLRPGRPEHLGQELFGSRQDLDQHALVILARLEEVESGRGIGQVGVIPAGGKADHDRSPLISLNRQITLGSDGVSRPVLGLRIDVEDTAFKIPLLGNQKGKGLFIGLPGALHE